MTISGNFTSDGQSEVFRSGVHYSGKGAINTLYASGSFSGGTLQVQASPDGQNWIDLTDAKLTASGAISFQAQAEAFRVALSGASGPDLDYWVV